MEGRLAEKAHTNSLDKVRNLHRPRWWIIAGLITLAVGSLTVYLFAGQLLSRGNPSAQDVIYGEPMWAMHTSMHAASGGMMGEYPEAAVDDSQTPIAEMKERFYDFGTLSTDQEVSREFVLTNRGGAALLITRAYTTCGCTSAEISSAVIPPGKAGLVTVYLDPRLASAGSSAIRRGIILETNDPQQPQIEIWVQASVNP